MTEDMEDVGVIRAIKSTIIAREEGSVHFCNDNRTLRFVQVRSPYWTGV